MWDNAHRIKEIFMECGFLNTAEFTVNNIISYNNDSIKSTDKDTSDKNECQNFLQETWGMLSFPQPVR